MTRVLAASRVAVRNGPNYVIVDGEWISEVVDDRLCVRFNEDHEQYVTTVYSDGKEATSFQVESRDARVILGEGHALFDLQIEGTDAVPVVVKEQQLHPVGFLHRGYSGAGTCPVANSGQCRPPGARVRTPLVEPVDDIFNKLLEAQLVNIPEIKPKHYNWEKLAWYKETKYYSYHIQNGHDTNKCN